MKVISYCDHKTVSFDPLSSRDIRAVKGPSRWKSVEVCGEARTVVAALAGLDRDDFPISHSQVSLNALQKLHVTFQVLT